MQFRLSLNICSGSAVMPINYNYPLSAVIYKIIQKADAAYAEFLHNTGYGNENKRFKLFTFSELRTPFRIMGDRLLLTSSTAELLVCFHLPRAAENFIKGLFIHQQLDVADTKSKVQFTVQQVEALPAWQPQVPAAIQEVILQPLSPLVCGLKNERGNYNYLSPEHPDFTYWLLYNWKEKYSTLHGSTASDIAFRDVALQVIPLREPPKSRLITIKANTPAETKIKGYTKFRMLVKAPADVLELAMDSGMGLYNAQGMGCVRIANTGRNNI